MVRSVVILAVISIFFLSGCATMNGVRDYLAAGNPSRESTVSVVDSGEGQTTTEGSTTNPRRRVYQSSSIKSSSTKVEESSEPSSDSDWDLPELKAKETRTAPTKSMKAQPDVNIVERNQSFNTPTKSENPGLNPYSGITPPSPTYSDIVPPSPKYSPNPIDVPEVIGFPAPYTLPPDKNWSGPGPYPGQSEMAQVPSSQQGQSRGTVRGGTPAPTFTAKTLTGKPFNLASQQGKVVLLDFWGTRCGPCIKAMPTVERIKDSYGPHQLTVVGMNLDETKSSVQSFLRRNHHGWENIHVGSQFGQRIQSKYGVQRIPTFVVIDQVGNIQYKGKDIRIAKSKVDELVTTPSLPAGGGMMVSQR